MKQIIGINSYDDFMKYRHIKNCAFYFGFVPKSWSDEFSYTISPNRRYREKEQITDIEGIRKICNNKGDKEIFVAFNTPFLSKVNFSQIKELVDQLISLAIDGIIVGTMSLAKYLESLEYKNIIISSLLAPYNIYSIKFFLQNIKGVKMIILPRELSSINIVNIAKEFPEINFEVFLIGDKCIYNEPYCFSEHGYDKELPESLCKYCNEAGEYYSRGKMDFRELLLEDKEIKCKSLGKIKNSFEDFEDFHNIDFHKIEKKIQNFSLYPNIIGFKVASRGRQLLNYVERIDVIIDETIYKNSNY